VDPWTAIIRHELGLDTTVSTSSNSLFKGLPSRLRPFGQIQHYFWYRAVAHSCRIS
jgi:hypothetical protein